MSILRKPIQRKLSAILGAEVMFERFNLSLVRGTLDVHGVSVAGDDPNTPVLTVARVRAEVALRKALAGEIVIKSLTIEQPVLNFVRHEDGTTNLPKPIKADEPANDRGIEHEDDQEEEAEPADESDGDAPSRWSFSARKILIVDGQARVLLHKNDTRYEYSADKLLAEMTQKDGGFDFTVIIESIGRRDVPVDLGQFRVVGSLAGTDDFSTIAAAKLLAHVELGETLRAKVESPALSSGQVSAEIAGHTDLRALRPLIPASIPDVSGSLELNGHAHFDRSTGLHLPDLTLRVTNFRNGSGAPSEGSSPP